MTVEFLERAGTDADCELWLVRDGGAHGIARIFAQDDPSVLEALALDATGWIGFSHPHVVPVTSVEYGGGRLAIVTGDERGPTLLQTAEKLPPTMREVWVAAQVAGIAEGLATMGWRKRGFIHRRASHEQTLVASDGVARLRAPLDWTISYTRNPNRMGAGRVIGSAAWLSPEQARGVPLTAASDVFQLASMLYAGLALRPAFHGETEMATLLAIIQGPMPAPPPTTIHGVADLVMRNLAREPELREQDPGAFAAALRACLPGDPPPEVLAAVAGGRPSPHPAPSQSAAIMRERCHLTWNQLAPTGVAGVRHCGECKTDVIEVRSIDALIPLLGRRCTAYRPD